MYMYMYMYMYMCMCMCVCAYLPIYASIYLPAYPIRVLLLTLQASHQTQTYHDRHPDSEQPDRVLGSA